MVAKSYQELKVLSEPFEQSGRMYIEVQLKSGKPKAVRWYSDQEYAKMYPEAKIDKSNDKYWKNQKDTLGFEKGYVTIFNGITAANETFFEESAVCRYAALWGWYVPSNKVVPQNLPSGVTTLHLPWEIVSSDPDKIIDSTGAANNIKRFKFQSTK